MNKNILVSIIVPIYNSGEKLKKCLDSLVYQNFENYEIILINDGSTDNSEEICKEYLNKFNNIKYFYKSNSGVSDTRNYGIDKSTGEYLTFVDSDDYIDLNFLNKLSKFIDKGYEMITCNHQEVYKTEIKNIEFSDKSQDITCPNFLNKYFQTYCLSTACKTLFKKELLLRNNIKFNNNLNYGEDMLFSLMAYVNSKKTYFLNYYGYFYVMNAESASHTNDIKKMEKQCNDYYLLYKFINEILAEKHIDFDYCVYVDSLMKNFIGAISKIFLTDNNAKYEIIDKIVLKYNEHLKNYNIIKSKLSIKYKIQIILLKFRKYYIFNFIKKMKK